MMRDSRSGRSPLRFRWPRTNEVQSRIARFHHLIDRRDVGAPILALRREHTVACGGQAVETALPLARPLDPAALDPAAILETQEGWVESRERERQLTARPRLDQLADLVAMTRTRFEEGQHDHLDAALLQLR